MVKLLRAYVWMPWRMKAMKDVASCDKPRLDASSLIPGDLRMGKPTPWEHGVFRSEFIGAEGEPREVNHLST